MTAERVRIFNISQLAYNFEKKCGWKCFCLSTKSVFVQVEERINLSMFVLSEMSFRSSSAQFEGKSAWRAALSSSPAAEPGPPHLLSCFFFCVLLTRLYSISI